eukprot:493541_1
MAYFDASLELQTAQTHDTNSTRPNTNTNSTRPNTNSTRPNTNTRHQHAPISPYKSHFYRDSIGQVNAYMKPTRPQQFPQLDTRIDRDIWSDHTVDKDHPPHSLSVLFHFKIYKSELDGSITEMITNYIDFEPKWAWYPDDKKPPMDGNRADIHYEITFACAWLEMRGTLIMNNVYNLPAHCTFSKGKKYRILDSPRRLTRGHPHYWKLFEYYYPQWTGENEGKINKKSDYDNENNVATHHAIWRCNVFQPIDLEKWYNQVRKWEIQAEDLDDIFDHLPRPEPDDDDDDDDDSKTDEPEVKQQEAKPTPGNNIGYQFNNENDFIKRDQEDMQLTSDDDAWQQVGNQTQGGPDIYQYTNEDEYKPIK